jgi:GH24 family phage-related lysozyme (muramidase)
MAKKNKSDWKPSENILKYLKSWEKFEPELYDDKKGNITIGYGFHLPHLLKKYKNGITVEEADKEFEGVVNTFVPEFIRRTPNFKNLNNNQRDALFSLFYNTGGPEYSKSPMLFKYLKEGDYDKAVKEINHNENEKGMGGQKKRRAFERRVFSTPTDRPWTVDDDSNYVLIEDKPVENESIEKDTNDSKYEDARHVEAKYGYTGYIGGGYDGNKVRVSDSNMKSVGISNNADPDKWYESVNPILDTDPISLIADFIPTMKRMLDPNRERSGEDTATDFEEKMWKAYTDGDISRLPASKYRFDDDDNDAQYVGLPQEQAILIQSLLDKEYMNNMLDEAYKNADEKSKLKIRDYKKVLDKLNKNIFENPGKWILVNEGVSPFREEVYGDNFEKVNEASGLGALKNFSVRWDPDAGMLDVKDDYDFSRKKIAEDIIPERDVPLRIRERIKYDPKKGSVLRNNDKALPKRFVRKYEEGGVVNKQREAYEYFTNKRGMSKIQALAIIGNLMAESGLKDDIYGDNGISYGIQQWHNERMDKLFKHAKKKGHSTPTFKDQLEFLADEYEGKTGYSNFLYTGKGKEGPGYYNYSRQDFMNADNLKDAVIAWNQGAERPHKSVIRNDDRYNYAMEVAKNLGLEIEENSVSSYGQMGFGDDAEIAASVTLPEVEVAAALPNPEAPSQEEQSEEERFRTWTETYGKDIINHLLTLDGKKDGDDIDYSMMYRQHQKESEEDKKMALINAVLPNIQLRIKGVTDN